MTATATAPVNHLADAVAGITGVVALADDGVPHLYLPTGRWSYAAEEGLWIKVCGRCSGTGYTHFEWVHDGICFKCNGRGHEQGVNPRTDAEIVQKAKADGRKLEREQEREREREQAARERQARWAAEREAERAAATPIEEGRQVVEGQVISIKWQANHYARNAADTMKITVKRADGSRIWATAPKAIAGEIVRGTVVRFTATVERSEKDHSFGYAKRPSKAEVVEQPEEVAAA